MRRAMGAYLFLLASSAALGLSAAEPVTPARLQHAAGASAASRNFDKVGPQVGDQLPDLKLRTIKGEPQRLADAWRGGPALLVTSSFTCPKSRSRWPELNAIAKQYGEKLNVVVVYVIEAHPVGSICPYKGIEEITSENERDNILRHQPKTLEDRLELAKEFKRYLRVEAPIYVDTLANQAWKAFGAAPNIAFLVDSDGLVVARQGWFEGEAMQKSVDALLSTPRGAAAAAKRRERMDRDKELAMQTALAKVGMEDYDLRELARDANTTKLAAVLKKAPEIANFVFSIRQGHNEETTLLMEVADDRNPAAAELLLQNGADIKARTASYDSALQLAAEVGQPEMVKLLLRHHADVNFPATGLTPLHEALIAKHADVARLLIAAGAKEDFFSDIALGKIEAVRKALIADPSRALRPDGAERMPLDYAAANGQSEIACLLLATGAPVVDDDLSRIYVPLHYAIQIKDAPMVELLLEAGSSPNTAFGYRGESPTAEPPLHMAIAGNDVEIVKILLAHKADLSRRDTYSMTPLHAAAEHGKTEIVRLLIKAGADVNAKQLKFDLPCGSGEEETPSRNTPLHFAAAMGNPATIKALLDAGAKIDAANVNGLTPLMSTIEPPLYTGINEESQFQNAETLLAAGANANVRGKEGQTALDFALAALKSAEKRETPRTGTLESARALVDLLRKHGAKPGERKPREK